MSGAQSPRTREFNRRIGRKLRALRLSRSYTQRQLGDQLGMTFQQIQKYENGSNRISAGILYQICDHFRVSSIYFFEDPPWWQNAPLADLDLTVAVQLQKCPPPLRTAIMQLIRAGSSGEDTA